MKILTYNRVLEELGCESPYTSDDTATKLSRLLHLSKSIPEYAESTFYKHNGFILESNAFTNNTLVPLGSTAQCYWKADCSFDSFCNLVSSLPLEEDKPFITEALGWDVPTDTRAIHVNSAVAYIDGKQSYLDSLSKSRRYKVKQALLQTVDYTVSIGTSMSLDDYDLVVNLLKERWGTNYGFALHNFHWALSNDTEFVYLSKDATLLGCAYFIREGNTRLFQGIAGKVPNLGAMLLSYYANFLSLNATPESPIILDPTCKTIIEDQSIDTYKRLVINQDRTKPLVSAFSGKPWFDKPYCLDNVWYPSDAPIVLGKKA